MDYIVKETGERHTLEAVQGGREINLVREFHIFGFEFDEVEDAWRCDQESFDWIAELYADYEQYLDVSEDYGSQFERVVDEDWHYLDLEIRFKEAVDRYRKDEAWRAYRYSDFGSINTSRKTEESLKHLAGYINEDMPRGLFGGALLWKEHLGRGNQSTMVASLDREWMISYTPHMDLFETTGDEVAARKWLRKIINNESQPEPTSFWAHDLPNIKE